MADLIRLPTGSHVAAEAIRSLEARPCGTPYIDNQGRAWPAYLIVETRNQIMRVPCASMADAEALRDELAALANADRARAQAFRAARGGGQSGDTTGIRAGNHAVTNGQPRPVAAGASPARAMEVAS